MSAADDYIDDLLDRTWGYEYPNRQKQKKTKTEEKAMVQTGDIVRKRNGTKLIEVTGPIYGNSFYGKYLHTGLSTGRLDISSVVLANDAQEQGASGMKGKLYQIKGTEPLRYGVGLAINSNGLYVLDMKDTGLPEAFKKSEVEVVMPFTFDVKFNGVATVYSYQGKEGSVAVGDLLLKTDGTKGITIAQVVAVNTKSERATKFFDGVKIQTTPLDS